jgi:CDGSH-type Zn-finger protein
MPLAKQVISADAKGYSLEWHESKKYPPQEKYALCRCGQSKSKPFCSGMHLKVNFDGTETAIRVPYLEQAEEIYGSALKLTDAQDLCASARFCVRAGGIWNLTRQSANAEAKRIAIEEAGNCPSGRLVVWDKKTGKAIEPEFECSIGLVEDPLKGVSGPIWVRGGIPVESTDGITYEIRNRITLCRCGKSANKPFCDGGHLHK